MKAAAKPPASQLQIRWSFAWRWDAATGSGTLYARDAAALNSLADGHLGAELPEEIRRVLPAVARTAHARAVQLANTRWAYRSVPQWVTVYPSGDFEHFECLYGAWEELIARQQAA